MKSYEIITILEKMAIEGRRHFSPLYVCQRLNTDDIKGVILFLFSDDGKDIVRPNFEIQCPEGDTDFVVHDLDSVPTDIVRTCHLCGIEYIPSTKNIWVTFDFKENYIEHVKKKAGYISSTMTRNKKNKLAMQV